jgi:hypothetical protein
VSRIPVHRTRRSAGFGLGVLVGRLFWWAETVMLGVMEFIADVWRMMDVGGRGKGRVQNCGHCLDGWMDGCLGARVRCGLRYVHATCIYIV